MSFLHQRILEHPGGCTRIVSGAGVLADHPSWVSEWLAGRTTFVVASNPVRQLLGRRIEALLDPAAEVVQIEIADGEAAKRVSCAEEAWRTMSVRGGTRQSRLITLGGGSTGDFGGFVAGCFMRGIEYGHIPTTLLAQVDASVGGKTGVDLPEAKNSVGLFHHPAWVLTDTEVLRTLDAGEIRSGLVEVVKMAVLLDPDLLAMVESSLSDLLLAKPASLSPVIAGAIEAKCRVVEMDPAESGGRRVLNFGHTLGHAIEGALGYEGIRHGEAVAFGMLFALRLGVSRGLTGGRTEVEDRLIALLARFGLPDLEHLPKLEPDELCRFVARDKKAGRKGVTWVLAAGLGKPELVEIETDANLREEIARFLEAPWDPRRCRD